MANEIILKTINLSNGETLGYRESGAGEKILILIHGNMTSSKHWDLVMENMPDEYKIYAVDLRGFGASTYKKPIDSLEDFSDDIKLFVDALGLNRFYIAGWSTGGAIAMNFTADYQEYIIKLILIESVGVTGLPLPKYDRNRKRIPGEILRTREEIINETVKFVPVLEAYRYRNKAFFRVLWDKLLYSKNQPDGGRYEEYIEDTLTQRNIVDVHYGLTVFNISNETHDIFEGSGKVDNITVPVLVIHGDKDRVVPIEDGIEIAQAVGDNARLLVFEDSGHSPMIDNLDALMEAIINFTK